MADTTSAFGFVAASCTVSYQHTPYIALGKDTTKCMEDIIRLNATFPNSTYKWQDNSSNAVYNVNAAGRYYCTVSNYCGSASDTIKIMDEACECDAKVPNVFSPNGDGVNDYFKPQLNCTPTNYKLSIFTRYGALILESFDYATGWNGIYNGKKVPVGTYFYILTVAGVSTKVKQYSGTVTVLR